MSAVVSIADRAPWLSDEPLQRLLAVLSKDGDEARIAGGAVRNALLGTKVSDIDIATTTLPEETARRAEAVGFKAVPTGAEHGTITVIANGRPVEVTTLRSDIETDGRRAKVAFGRDWRRDAERRDFTINALYADAAGTVIDHVGGVADIESRTLRFIGDAEARIREDYLRILRFFRFFAWYGAGRPDADGLRACARLKDGLEQLSSERVWTEMKKLLAAPDPSRALLWMRQSGVLTKVLPESEKWGIDAIHGLVRTGDDLGWAPDAMLRLESLIPPDAERVAALAGRMRLSKAEAERLGFWASTPRVDAATTESALAKMLYRGDSQAFVDRLRLNLAAARWKAEQDDKSLLEAGGYSRLLRFAEKWQKPIFPVKGGDLLALGTSKGPEIGALLGKLETDWVESGFMLSRDALLERAAHGG